MGTEPLNDALTLFAGTAPTYGPAGLANHGPMVAEALAHLGRADAIGDWPPATGGVSTTHHCRDGPCGGGLARALGHQSRFPEWLALFEREIADRPVAAVVGRWAPRLLPGAVGAATTG